MYIMYTLIFSLYLNGKEETVVIRTETQFQCMLMQAQLKMEYGDSMKTLCVVGKST